MVISVEHPGAATQRGDSDAMVSAGDDEASQVDGEAPRPRRPPRRSQQPGPPPPPPRRGAGGSSSPPDPRADGGAGSPLPLRSAEERRVSVYGDRRIASQVPGS